MSTLSEMLLTVNSPRRLAYLFESQPWRCWSPSCEVASETLSFTHTTGQSFISHIHPKEHTHIHTRINTHTHMHTGYIALPSSCVLIFLLLFFSPLKHVASCCFYFRVHSCFLSCKRLPGVQGSSVVLQMTDVHCCHTKVPQRKWLSLLGLTPSVRMLLHKPWDGRLQQTVSIHWGQF